jgi:A-factor biosynthesis hotdog domain
MNASASRLLLVGDRFAGFAVQPNVQTVHQVLEQLRSGTGVASGQPVRITAGQGVTASQWQAIREEIGRRGLYHAIDLQPFPQALVSQDEVHKRRGQNALIANLRQAGMGYYVATLRLHNDNELLIDHQTGQHVQGMVAIEAARQMFLAVSERFYAKRYPGRNYYYVIEAMQTHFENFLFPLSATIEFTAQSADLDDPGRLAFTAEICLVQAGRRASRTTVAYSAFDPEVITTKEHRRAQYAIDHALQEADDLRLSA